MRILELFEGRKVWIGPKGYPMIWLYGKNKMLHEYVWEQENGKKPKGSIIHHKDINKSNFDIKNLLLCKNESEHKKIHAGWIKNDDGEWIAKPCTRCREMLSLDEFYQRKGYTPSPQCKGCHYKTQREYLNRPEVKLRNKKYKENYYQRSKNA